MQDIASITRDKKTKTATLHLEKDIPWKIFSGKDMDSISYRSPVLAGDTAGVFDLPVDRHSRACFALETPGKTFILAEHHLPMTGGYNIRDLGGYRAADGRRIAWGKFFRADDLAHLTGEDIAYLASIPIVSVFDFRTRLEVDAAPDRLPDTVRTIAHHPLAPGNVDPNEIRSATFAAYEDTDAFMNTVYRELVKSEKIIDTWRELFRHIQNDEEIPLLFHCTAGKDRTGMAAAFLLFALGVDRETIFRDYLDSNTYLSGKYTRLTRENPQLAALYSVRPSYLQTGIDTMENLEGSVENYLVRVLDINIKALREKYLYEG